jgi:hypothetical protein
MIRIRVRAWSYERGTIIVVPTSDALEPDARHDDGVRDADEANPALVVELLHSADGVRWPTT